MSIMIKQKNGMVFNYSEDLGIQIAAGAVMFGHFRGSQQEGARFDAVLMLPLEDLDYYEKTENLIATANPISSPPKR